MNLDFSTTNIQGWPKSSGWLAGTNVRVVSEADAPQSGPNVLEYRFYQGLGDGAGGDGAQSPGSANFMWTTGATPVDQMGYNKMYVSFWWRVKEPWQQHPVFSKMIYFGSNQWYNADPLPAQFFFVYSGQDAAGTWTGNNAQYDALGNSATQGRIDFWLQAAQEYLGDTQRSMRAGGGGFATPSGANGVATTIYPGTWYHIELLVEGNTGGNANGVVQWWVNGVSQGRHTNVKFKDFNGFFPTNGNGRFTGVDMNPVWGGAGGVKTQTDYMQFDHLYISQG
jgi:hypothetical protein